MELNGDGFVSYGRPFMDREHPPSNHLDLNKNPLPQQSCDTDGDIHSISSQSNEVEATAEIGTELGFQIEPTNEILVSILNGDGEKAGNQ
ncbi:hypothetical protein L1887_36224 [Cichorium endivia]|nr:hypothetical protein L1887_36224 [Cichorium endivia]